MSESRDVLDYAVVGAGCAGAYIAYRLATERPSERFALFEASTRIGGRLLTVQMPGMSHKAELGGMRFTDKQAWINGLVDHLQLEHSPFDYPLRAWYIRGRHLRGTSQTCSTCSHCGGPAGLPYTLLEGESPDLSALIKRAISLALGEAFSQMDDEELERIGLTGQPDLERITFDQWAFTKRHVKFHGRPLYEVGFWNLLQWYLGSEAFLLLHDALGYESVLANWNAAEALPWFLADFVVNYRTLVDGMDTLPRRLVEAAGREHFRQDHELVTVQSGSNGILELGFQGRDKERTELVFARKLILAIPKAPLKRINEINGLGLSRLLESVTAHPLFKLFLGYDRAWWAEESVLGASFGRAVTDLPIRQVYYFSAVDAKTALGSRAAVMASYSDEHYVDFWGPLLLRKPPHYTGAPFPDSEDGRREQKVLAAFGVWNPLVKKAHRQLQQLHPAASAEPEPYVALMFDWTDRRKYFGGGWHTWNVRVRPWQVMKALIQPSKDLNLHVCGEAFSSDQGWVEGALRSADLVLRHLGMGRPTWISETDYRALESTVED